MNIWLHLKKKHNLNPNEIINARSFISDWVKLKCKYPYNMKVGFTGYPKDEIHKRFIGKD